MNDETYEDYIRTILGYPKPTQNYYDNYQNINTIPNYTNKNFEEFYPEIYNIIYPMVKKVCSNQPITVNAENIEKMTDEIYFAVEEQNSTQNNRSKSNYEKGVSTTKSTSKEPIRPEKKEENRQIGNNSLRDLIKILLLRELIGRPNFPGSRPPMGPPPPPPRPGPGPRPPFPIRPRYDIYEN